MGNCLRRVLACINIGPSPRPEPVPSPKIVTEKKFHETTVLVVGNIAVGKTTLINCLLQSKK